MGWVILALLQFGFGTYFLNGVNEYFEVMSGAIRPAERTGVTMFVGQSVFGLLSWPFDTGKNLKLGTTGVLMSLPELLFFNIRKGSYKYLSYIQFVNDEKATY